MDETVSVCAPRAPVRLNFHVDSLSLTARPDSFDAVARTDKVRAQNPGAAAGAVRLPSITRQFDRGARAARAAGP
jgi:hypothetical protein